MKLKPSLRFFRPTALALASFVVVVVPARSATFYKLDTTTMNNASDWTAGSWPSTSLDTLSWAPSGTTQAVITLPNAMNMTLGGNISCNNLFFAAGTATPVANGFKIIPDGNTLSLYSSATAAGTAAFSGTGNVFVSIGCPITVNANTTINSFGLMDISGAIGESGGSRTVTIANGSAAGTSFPIHFAAANTYSGLTTVGAGNLLTLSGGGTIGNGSATAGLTMTSSILGDWLDLGGTTQNVGGTVTFGNAVIQNGTLNGNNAIAAGFTGGGVVSANLGGTAGLTNSAASIVLNLSGNLSYTGGTTIGNATATILTTKPLPLTGTISLTGILAARVGGAGQWASSDIDNLLGYASLTVVAGGNLGFDTTDGNFTYGNAISGPTPANLGILKRGANTLTLSGASIYQKSTTIRAGTLIVDNTAGGSLSSSSPLTFTGSGTFNYNTASTAQSLGALTLSAGGGTVQLNRTADTTLTFASLARTAGATANLSLGGGTPGSGNGFILTGAAAGFINQGTFLNGADYAYMDGAGTFVRLPVYGVDSGFTAADTITASTHALLTTTPAAQDDLALSTLKLSGSGVGFALNSGKLLTLANGGILKTGGGTAGTISGGNVQTTDSLHDIVVRTDSSADSLAIGSTLGFAATRTGTATSNNTVPVSDTTGFYNGMSVLVTNSTDTAFVAISTISSFVTNTSVTLSTTPLTTSTAYTLKFYGNSLTKSGAGTLTLSGANNLVNVNLNGGQLNINNTIALGSGTPTTFTGAAQNNPMGRFTINEGTTIDNTSGSPLTMAFKYNQTWNGSFTFVGSNDLEFIDPNQNGCIGITNDITLTTQTLGKTLKFKSNISTAGIAAGPPSTAKITKNGPGTLVLGITNGGLGLNGGVVINEGVYSGGGGQPDSAYSGPMVLGDTTPSNSKTAILNLITAQSCSAPVTVRAGSSGTLAIFPTISGVNVNGPTVLSNRLILGVSTGSFNYNGMISGTGGLNIGGTGSFVVSGTTIPLVNAGTVVLNNNRNSYTGNTVINSGTLRLGVFGAINNTALLSLAAGTTLDVAGTTGFTLGSSTALSASGTGTTAGTTAARIIGPSGGTVSLGAQGITLAWSGDSSGTDTDSPCLYVSQGALTLNNNAFTINGSTLGIGTYRLIQVGDGLTGTLNQNVTPSYSVTGTAIDGTKTNVISSDGGGNLILTVSAGGGDITPPTLTSIVDDKSGGPVTTGTLVTYTVTFNEDIDAASVSAADFDNNGTATVTIGTITETTPGVFTVQATPTTTGSLKLRIPTGAVVEDTSGNDLVVPVSDDTTITVQTAYDAWSGGAVFDADANGDGVKNGLAFLLGATNPNVSALDKLPLVTQSGGNLILTFSCLNAASRGAAALSVQHSSDFGISDAWTSVLVTDSNSGPTSGVTFTVIPGSPINSVTATISSSEAVSGKVFGRLQANP